MESNDSNLIYKMCVPDEHFSRIQEMLKDAGRIGIYLTHKDGTRVRFYHKDGKTFADERKDDNSVFTQEVIPASEIEAVKRQHSSFREELMKRLVVDFPDDTDEEREAHADVLTEANEAIKRLILSGVEPKVALYIIQSVLADKNIVDNTGGSAEALAEVLRDRERMFGNPKDPNYGKDSDERIDAPAEKIDEPKSAEGGCADAKPHPDGLPIV